MQFVLIPAAAYLLCYAPGYFLLRGHCFDQPPAGSRLFREVLLSVGCASWIGFVLAELGLYSIWILLSLLAGISGTAWLALSSVPRAGYRLADGAGLAVLLLTTLWVAPPFDTRIAGADSAGYLASGIHLARHGTLVIHDPTLPALSADLKRALFPSVAPDRGSPPYLRLPGSLVLRSLDTDEVLPAFHHLIAVWIAVSRALFGAGGAQWPITLFAGLSMWALIEFAVLATGFGAAMAFLLVLLLLSPQYWYSRFLMPEVPAQFFVWSGLACLAAWRRLQRPVDAILAGMGFGLAGLMRIENAAFLGLALPAAFVGSGIVQRRGLGWLLAVVSALWLHAILHLLIYRTHYVGILRSFLEGIVTPMLGSPATLMTLAGVFLLGLLMLLWQLRRTTVRRWHFDPLFPLLAVIVCLAVRADYRYGFPNLHLLGYYTGIPLLVGGGLGWVLAWRTAGTRVVEMRAVAALTAIVFAQFLFGPQATPVPIWVIRRAVTILLPGLCFGLILLTRTVWQRWHWSAALLCLSAAIAGEISSLRVLRAEAYYPNASRHIETLATLIPPGARVLYDVQLAGSGLAQTLWAEYDLPAYLMPSNDLTRIQQLVRAFDGAPVFWVGTGTSPPPHAPQLHTVPLALYEFLVTTPALNAGSRPGTTTNWDFTVGLYSLQEPK